MKCEAMLLRMLDADPAELRGAGGTSLTAHLYECPRCRAVAAQILADGSRLAEAPWQPDRRTARARTGRRAPAPRRLATAGVLVAGVLALVVLRFASHPRVPTPAPTIAAAASRVPPPPAAVPAPRNRPGIVAGIAVGHPIPQTAPVPAAVPTAVSLRPLATAAPIEPDRLGGGGAVAAAPITVPTRGGAALAVHPPPGVRTAVFQTDNPTITVVWLY